MKGKVLKKKKLIICCAAIVMIIAVALCLLFSCLCLPRAGAARGIRQIMKSK